MQIELEISRRMVWWSGFGVELFIARTCGEWEVVANRITRRPAVRVADLWREKLLDLAA